MVLQKYIAFLIVALWTAFLPTQAQVKLEQEDYGQGFQSTYPLCGATFQVKYIWVDKQSPMAAQINQTIRQAWHQNGLTPQEEANDFIENYKKDLKEVSQNTDTLQLFFTYESQTNDTCLLNTPELLVLSRYAFDYYGGAHGTYATMFLNIDPRTGQLIYLKDLLKPEYEKMLPSLVEKEARRYFDVPKGQKLSQYGFFVDELPLPETFAITKKGLRFVYGLYSVAPYAMGEIDLTVSYAELKPLLLKNTVIDKLLKP